MKSEYHIMERCKQPIKIEKLCILTFSYRVSERNIPQTVLCCHFFSVFIFLVPSIVIIIVIHFILGLSQSFF